MKRASGILWIGVFVWVSTAAIAQEPPPQSSPEVTHEPATLVFWNRPIIEFRATIGESTPAVRAQRSAARLRAMVFETSERTVVAQRTRIGDLEGFLVMANSQLAFGVAPGDVDPESGTTIEQLSAEAAKRLQDALIAQALELRPGQLVRAVAWTLAATALFAAVIWTLLRLRRRMLDRFDAMVKRRAVSILKVDVQPFLLTLEQSLIRLFIIAVTLSASYLWVIFVLSRFSYTKPWASGLGGHLRAILVKMGAGMLHALPGIFTVLLILVATRVVVRVISGFFRAVELGQLDVGWLQPETAKASRQAVIVIVWLFAITVAYPYIPGSGSEAFKGVSVIAGLMLSLGSAGFINQLLSGFVLIYSRALKPGDLVSVGDTVGKVTVVGLLSTKVTSLRREEVTIPNAVVVSSSVTNFSRLAGPDGAMAATSVTIGYDAPWRQVHALLLLAAERTPGIRKQPKPFVLQRSLSDFFVEYEVRFHLERADDRFPVLSELHAQIQDAFNESGVQIMSPHFEGQPDKQVVVPKSHWFAPPATRPAGSGE